MEYALEGYGYSFMRSLRSLFAERRRSIGSASERPIEHLPATIERNPEGLGDHWSEIRRRMRDHPFARLKDTPELLATLRPLGLGGPVRGLALRVASATRAAFDAFQRTPRLLLDICCLDTGERGDEHLLLAVHSRELRADVRVGDEVAAGVLVALHGEPGGFGRRLEILPRMYRKVCENGAIVFAGDATARELDPRLLAHSGTEEPLARALENELRALFDPQTFESAINRFRHSAGEPMDEESAKVHLGALGLQTSQAVLQRYRAQGDFTRWGLANAVTAAARTAPSGLMLELERLGGKLALQSAAVGQRVAPQAPPRRSKKLDVA